jgi:hypothetical protein
MLDNILILLLSFFISFFQILGSFFLGRRLISGLGSFRGDYFFHYSLAIGVAFQGIILSIFSLLQIAYPWVIFLIWLIPLLIGIKDSYYINMIKGMSQFLSQLPKVKKFSIHWVIALSQLILIFYAFSYCFSAFRGADLAVYHLESVRDIIWNHGALYNAFSFGAGIPLGWHNYGLSSFLLGGESAYLGLTFWFFLVIGNLASVSFKRFLPDLDGIYTNLATLFIWFVCVSFLQGSLPNNDIPATYFELVLLVMVFTNRVNNSLFYAVILGTIAGFVLMIKLTNVVGVAILVGCYFCACWRDQSRMYILVTLITASIIASIWPIHTFLNSGAFLPQALVPHKLHGTYYPHFIEAARALEVVHGNWMISNAVRFFSSSMFLIPVLIAGLFLYSIADKSRFFNHNKLILLLFIYGISRFLIFILISPRLDVLFHDRYHLVTYLLFVFLGYICWLDYLHNTKQANAFDRLRSPYAIYAAITLVFIGVLSDYEMKFPDAKTGEPKSLIMHNILFQSIYRMKEYLNGPEWRNDPFFSFIRKHTDERTIIATTLMAPYDYDRKFLQILPVSQNMIDLEGSPKQILSTLRSLGVSYLHINSHPGLVPGATPMIAKWLQSLYRIPNEPGVRLVLKNDNDSIQFSALYKID